jgi:hypothetical protein
MSVDTCTGGKPPLDKNADSLPGGPPPQRETRVARSTERMPTRWP